MSATIFGKVTPPNRGMIHNTLQYIYLLTHQFLCNAQSDIFSIDYSLLGSTIIYVAFKMNVSAAALPFLFHFFMHLTCIYCIVHSSSTR